MSVAVVGFDGCSMARVGVAGEVERYGVAVM